MLKRWQQNTLRILIGKAKWFYLKKSLDYINNMHQVRCLKIPRGWNVALCRLSKEKYTLYYNWVIYQLTTSFNLIIQIEPFYFNLWKYIIISKNISDFFFIFLAATIFSNGDAEIQKIYRWTGWWKPRNWPQFTPFNPKKSGWFFLR